MLISSSCLLEPGKCPGKPFNALPGRPAGSIFRPFDITFRPRGYLTIIDEGTTVVIISGMIFCDFKCCPLNTPRNAI